MEFESLFENSRACDEPDEVTITPELPRAAAADKIERYLAQNPPSPLSFPRALPVSAVQETFARHEDWHLRNGREVLATLLTRGQFRWPRSGVADVFPICELVEADYHYREPHGRANQLYARQRATACARDAVWTDLRIQALVAIAEHIGLTQRQILTQINQAVAIEAAGFLRGIGIAEK